MLCVSKKEDYSKVGRGGWMWVRPNVAAGLGFSPHVAVRWVSEGPGRYANRQTMVGEGWCVQYLALLPRSRSFLPPFLVFHTSICVLVERHKDNYGLFFQLFHQNTMYQWCINTNKAELIVTWDMTDCFPFLVMACNLWFIWKLTGL